jgi:hypothetical protein
MVNKMNEAILRTILGADKNVELNLRISPMPNTKKIKNLEGLLDGVIAGFIFSLGMVK